MIFAPSALPAPAPAPASGALTRYGFAGMVIGAPLAQLQDVRPKAVCAPTKHDVIDCIAPNQPVGGGYLARDLRYRFIDGRLAQIQFRSSIDGFAFIVAKLKQDFGAPADIRRDAVRLYGRAFPHVAFTWRNGRSTIEMSDPATPDQLEVRITADGERSQLSAAAA